MLRPAACSGDCRGGADGEDEPWLGQPRHWHSPFCTATWTVTVRQRRCRIQANHCISAPSEAGGDGAGLRSGALHGSEWCRFGSVV